MLPVREVARSLAIYASEFDDRLPLADWQDVVSPYLERQDADALARDPLRPVAGNGNTIAFHHRLVGVQLSRIESPSDTAMIYLSTQLGPNALGDGTDLRFVQNVWTVVGFADSTARFQTSNTMDRSVFRLKLTSGL
jgi:hypothetical protein